MYQNFVWPGAYSFQQELKLFVTWFKEQADLILLKILETERLLDS